MKTKIKESLYNKFSAKAENKARKYIQENNPDMPGLIRPLIFFAILENNGYSRNAKII